MKTSYKPFFALLFSLVFTVANAQSAEEIVDNYIENIGGQDAWNAVENMQVTGIATQQGTDGAPETNGGRSTEVAPTAIEAAAAMGKGDF